MSIISVIAAMDEHGAIGIDQHLLWHLPNDMKFFKKTTDGHTVVMGRKTFESLPKGALPNRKNIVLTSNPDAKYENCIICHTLQDALKLTDSEEEVFIIGGGTLYEQVLPVADKLYLTLVHHIVEAADTFFPEIDFDEWNEIMKTSYPADDKNPYNHSVLVYVRRNK
ncbi:MAG: dihydrofolate reductase [Tannerella sp.]|jgi:dihydrofolate reductase|nr:dihydrofolate reductase [Tannerella sp.]